MDSGTSWCKWTSPVTPQVASPPVVARSDFLWEGMGHCPIPSHTMTCELPKASRKYKGTRGVAQHQPLLPLSDRSSDRGESEKEPPIGWGTGVSLSGFVSRFSSVVTRG